MSNKKYIEPNQRTLHQSGLRLLLLVQFFTVLPFLQFLPVWLVLVFCLVVFWRWRVLRGEFKKPPKWLVAAAIGLGLLSLYLSGLNRYSLDTAVALCVLGYLLKSLEVLRKRDGIFQVYLGYFLAGVYLLYRFDPIGALVMILLLGFNTLALQAVTAEAHFKLRYGLKQTSFIVLGAIPVMIAGYLFFPRLPPLWHIPNEQRGAVTGMTDEITPGSIAELARSTEPAFRVSFEGDLPPRNEWYWRGNTMSVFDGRSWRAQFGNNNPFSWPSNVRFPEAETDGFRYTVTMENSGQRWLYFLDWPTFVRGDNIAILPDGRAAKRQTLNANFRYIASSSGNVSWPDQSRIIDDNLQLPNSGNAELRAWAENARTQVDSDFEFVRYLIEYIQSEPFYYTLRPPAYGGSNSLADFWLGDRRGFCSHYASSVAYILRAVDIPTRLVGGYLGGNYNENGNYIQVRQMEAHVWLEFWFEGQWIRFDPTAAVAPFRVEQNLDSLMLESQPEDLPLMARVGRLSLLNGMSMYWDSLVYQWQTIVLDYQNDQAISWFESSFGRFTPMKAAILFLGLLGSVGLVLAISLGLIRLPRRHKEPYKTIFALEKRYFSREQGETLRDFFGRIRESNVSTPLLVDIEKEVERLLYSPEADNSTNLTKMMAKLRKHRQ